MAHIIGIRAFSVVAETEIVAKLVAARLGKVLRARNPFGKDERRLQALEIRPAPHIHEGDAAHRVRIDRETVLIHPVGEQDMPDIGPEGGGPLRRHVDVERCVVLGHPFPDFGDRVQFGLGVGREIGIFRIGLHRVHGPARHGVPLRAGHILAAEVEIDDARCARLAVQREGDGRIDADDCLFGYRRRLIELFGGRSRRIDIEEMSARAGPQIVEIGPRRGQPVQLTKRLRARCRVQPFDTLAQFTGRQVLHAVEVLRALSNGMRRVENGHEKRRHHEDRAS